ncbi:hypothetical protein NF556_17565 [Ornithinimicrobium faecis]|uniref:Uncharacterized protein n=1 Tax=Ornithinimicrobium faecis TaxID=2934158 RepID=A0ABY4YTB3_9MICO|nr:hypothetical protein [Ornithinimicrobium sp. HY1793]USQ79392.1 hypothetical protein NF556_17565 [Ornithinimicrobium sp. HY1793]
MNGTGVEITAGLGGFLAVFFLACVVILLGFDLNKRLRRLNHQEELRLEEERLNQERRAREAGEGDTGAPGEGPTAEGPVGEGPTVDGPVGEVRGGDDGRAGDRPSS